MILSVSRRTDIPAYYSEWFMNRLNEGFVYIRNLYCYATFNQELAEKNCNMHSPQSPLLIGLADNINVTERRVKSLKENNYTL